MANNSQIDVKAKSKLKHFKICYVLFNKINRFESSKFQLVTLFVDT